MATTKIKRSIKASTATVFDTVAHIENFSKAMPHITKIEILSDVQKGQGTRFRETRLINGREASTELEVTEYAENERVRIVSDAGGTIWDTVFTVAEADGATDLTMVMEAKPYKVMSKLINPMIKGMVYKAIEKDMDAVKVYCEANGSPTEPA